MLRIILPCNIETWKFYRLTIGRITHLIDHKNSQTCSGASSPLSSPKQTNTIRGTICLHHSWPTPLSKAADTHWNNREH